MTLFNKIWKDKAVKFAAYYRDDYNKDRHIAATLGSYGYTFTDDIINLQNALNEIGETFIANEINKILW